MSPKVSNPYHDKYLNRLVKNLCSHLPILVLTHHIHYTLYAQPLLRAAEQPLESCQSRAFLGWNYFSGLRYKRSDWTTVSFQRTPVYSIQRPSTPSVLTLG